MKMVNGKVKKNTYFWPTLLLLNVNDINPNCNEVKLFLIVWGGEGGGGYFEPCPWFALPIGNAFVFKNIFVMTKEVVNRNIFVAAVLLW